MKFSRRVRLLLRAHSGPASESRATTLFEGFVDAVKSAFGQLEASSKA